MAEGGGIGPRSSKGTRAYKARSAAKQSPSGHGIHKGHHGSIRIPGQGFGESGLRVFAQLYGDVLQR